MLHSVSDGTIVLCAAWCLIGYALGFCFALAIWWRPITRQDGATLRLLRMQLEDSDRHLAALQARNDDLARLVRAKQDRVDELSGEVSQLYKDADRLARLYVERAALTFATRVNSGTVA